MAELFHTGLHSHCQGSGHHPLFAWWWKHLPLGLLSQIHFFPLQPEDHSKQKSGHVIWCLNTFKDFPLFSVQFFWSLGFWLPLTIPLPTLFLAVLHTVPYTLILCTCILYTCNSSSVCFCLCTSYYLSCFSVLAPRIEI